MNSVFKIYANASTCTKAQVRLIVENNAIMDSNKPKMIATVLGFYNLDFEMEDIRKIIKQVDSGNHRKLREVFSRIQRQYLSDKKVTIGVES
jgi:hypothetical protein